MSVLHDVLAKMMTDFLSKEDDWVAFSRSYRAQPAPFTLTLDTPDFRQLIKELNESEFMTGPSGMAYRRLIIDGVPYEGTAASDEAIRARNGINVCYPAPACKYIYAARIQHNCTLAPLADPDFPDLSDFRMTPVRATGSSVPSARDRFIEENVAMRDRGVPESQRPGYVSGSCTCVDCRFNNMQQDMPRIVRANASDVLRQQDRDRLAGMELRPAIVDEWSTSWTIGPPMPVLEPIDTSDRHPNDPRPRMPRLNDGQARGAAATVAGTNEALRRIWAGRTRF